MPLSRRTFLASAALAALPRVLRAAEPSASSVPEEAKRLPLTLGFMVWKIGDILDFDAQVAWVAEAGFESIGFHASPGIPGKWRGIEPDRADAAERQRLVRLLAPFRQYEIHAPFKSVLLPETPEETLSKLEQVLQFASDVGASVITVHAKPPRFDAKAAPAAWHKALDRLDRAAEKAKVRIGIEFSTDFQWLRNPRREWIGATLDVGHMYFDPKPHYLPWGTIGAQIRDLDDVLYHLHLHDNTGTLDHIEIGTGKIDWNDILQSLAAIGYRHSMTLELNPLQVTPEGIRRSADFLRKRVVELKLA